ncbi:D-alanyl-D-alanine carboxypeptidase family protein [Romboutsia sp. 1001713B170131_170501_G6]|uniref:D-alanyl-D-alanine carboxypeptidase family protein n=1 Tax=Romboutsia sp. 1001713B170131_170501_G6 TaxID=2787108 RepID=UPI002ED045AC
MKKFKSFKTIILTILILALTSVSSLVNAQDNTGQIQGIVAESAIVMDMDTGEIIASKNANKQMPVASTIKLLTSLIYAENTSKSEQISFTEDALKTTQTALNNFKKVNPGDKISSDDLMKGVMIFSANDAAYLMADSVAGNTKDFVKMMNDRVKSMGLKNTYIVNPCGLESNALDPENKEINLSSAYDIAIIAREAFKNEWIRDTISEKNKKVTVNLAGSPVIIETRNKMLGQHGNIGGKTGNEAKAGRCFVGFFERDGRKLVTVALNSVYGANDVDVFNDTKIIADDGYNAKKQVFKKAGEKIDTVKLEYKLFGLFGPKKTVDAPIVVSKDIMYYKNPINDKNAKIEYNTKDKNAWKLADKEVELTFSLPNYKAKVPGKVDISLFDLIKPNIVPYGIFVAVVGVVLAVSIILYRKISTNRMRKRKGYIFYKK